MQFAVIDIICRCDNKSCGMGSTYLFRKKDNGWMLAGKMTSWVN